MSEQNGKSEHSEACASKNPADMENTCDCNATLPDLSFRQFMDDVHENACNKGFWGKFPSREDVANPLVLGSKLCLIHQEISEAFDSARDGIDDVPDTHCPEHLNFTVELADTIIRILDLSAKLQLPIVEALIAKHAYNKTRPYMHGRKI